MGCAASAFAAEVATAVADEIGPGRTGIRLSPGNLFNLGAVTENGTHELYPALVQVLVPLKLAYPHMAHGGDEELLHTLRKLWPTTLVNRAGTDISTRVKDIEQGHVCLGSRAYPPAHDDRHAAYRLNTILGGSM